MKKLISSFAVTLILFSLFLTGCSNAANEENTTQDLSTPTSEPTPLPYGPDTVSGDWEWEDIPEEYRVESDQPGTLIKETYTTQQYAKQAASGETGLVIEKAMWVYLPYGYDETVQYDILYLLHGGGQNEGFWFSQGNNSVGNPYTGDQGAYLGYDYCTKNVVDNLIAKGESRPVIIVTPTFYSGNESDEEEGVDLQGHFWEELRNDIIPLIEGKYSTFANGDTSDDSLIASRDHRAYAGLSMGSMTGQRSVMYKCTDIFSWFGLYSGGLDEESRTDLAQALNSEFKDYPINYYFNACGTNDSLVMENHLSTYDYLKENVDGLVDGENSTFMFVPGMRHEYKIWVLSLYNSLRIFFD